MTNRSNAVISHVGAHGQLLTNAEGAARKLQRIDRDVSGHRFSNGQQREFGFDFHRINLATNRFSGIRSDGLPVRWLKIADDD